MTKTTTHDDWVLQAIKPRKIECIEAYFGGHGYVPHRHDTYAIGLTLAGVQSFRYRRSQRHSLPGTILVLHPDELHDGEAGTEAGFRYRMAYIEPSMIQQILGGKSLPFVEGGLSSDMRLRTALLPLLQAMDADIDPMEEDDALHDLAHALVAVAGQRRIRRYPDFIAVERARAYILDQLEQSITLDKLAEASGLDRWQLCRDFRTLYGTSPYRYLIMRRLDAVRRLMMSGQSIAESALSAGFFDQSHMARQFTSAYGVSPARWFRRIKHSR
ncbi:AraC family transcriptional regulator [Advenella kashmirensis W13003]|uniref:AraC family transcriptional regulator n=1 Tax=Advenella kashmirensis W13003 TaxID=1424334 RepID=V8QSN1_9BURK|nr:AraC family transcriptional regulator [Advenella kashmirensis]ETF02004.1 AraC family transcriptional regulator [Advenella kashmirensis W13003]